MVQKSFRHSCAGPLVGDGRDGIVRAERPADAGRDAETQAQEQRPVPSTDMSFAASA